MGVIDGIKVKALEMTILDYPACSVHARSVMSDFVTLWTVALQTPLSMGFSRQEYWSGLPFPSPEDFPDPKIEFMSPVLAGRFFTTELPAAQIQRWESSEEVRRGETHGGEEAEMGVMMQPQAKDSRMPAAPGARGTPGGTSPETPGTQTSGLQSQEAAPC